MKINRTDLQRGTLHSSLRVHASASIEVVKNAVNFTYISFLQYTMYSTTFSLQH